MPDTCVVCQPCRQKEWERTVTEVQGQGSSTYIEQRRLALNSEWLAMALEAALFHMGFDD